MGKTPTRTAVWNSATEYPSTRVENLNRAIPATFNRAKNSTNPDDISAYKTTLNQMLATLTELEPEHPHLTKYTPEAI